MNLVVRYFMSEEWIDERIIVSGEMPHKEKVVIYEMRALTEAERASAVAAGARSENTITVRLVDHEAVPGLRAQGVISTPPLFADHKLSHAEIFDRLAGMAAAGLKGAL